jgi:FkbH-like protein
MNEISSQKTRNEMDSDNTRVEREVKIKCIVWDLDNTLWDGILLEDNKVFLRENVLQIIRTLDSRGILHSIASKNDHDLAMDKLKQFQIEDYFLFPQINWNAKGHSLKNISKLLNIGIDSMAFIDDQMFELEEVRFSLPDVLCINATDLSSLLDMPEMKPQFITDDSKLRRQMYITDIQRKKIEDEFVGPTEEFLASLNMILTISPAKEDDLQRAEELTIRTNQLNTTGYTFSYDELNFFRKSSHHTLLICSLEDKFGPYGKIGLVLIDKNEDDWTIRLLLFSCRVMSRGIGNIVISHIKRLAKLNHVRLYAEMISNDRNRMMYMTFKFTGFKEERKVGNKITFVNDLSEIQSIPDYIKVKCSE